MQPEIAVSQLLNPSPDVLRALTLVGFDLFLEIHSITRLP
jgi:hypothetical protein